jgi:hypothetical protein
VRLPPNGTPVRVPDSVTILVDCPQCGPYTQFEICNITHRRGSRRSRGGDFTYGILKTRPAAAAGLTDRCENGADPMTLARAGWGKIQHPIPKRPLVSPST